MAYNSIQVRRRVDCPEEFADSNFHITLNQMADIPQYFESEMGLDKIRHSSSGGEKSSLNASKSNVTSEDFKKHVFSNGHANEGLPFEKDNILLQ